MIISRRATSSLLAKVVFEGLGRYCSYYSAIDGDVVMNEGERW